MTASFDVSEVRARFPALELTQDGRPITYFDGPGGTQVPASVIEAVGRYYRESNANHEGAFLTSRRSDAGAHEAHVAFADFLNADSADEVKFGANMTTLTFHVSRSIAATMSPGDVILVTTLDHDANVSPWHAAARDRDLVVRTVDIHAEDGTLDLEDFERKLTDRTKLVAVGYASNALGTINPVARIVEAAHAVGAWSYIDAVHFAPHGPIDVQALDTDFLVCSVYKFFGPHVGVLYGKQAVLDRLPPYKVRPADDRFETGTANFEGIAGSLAALDYLGWIGERFGEGFAGEFPELGGRRLRLKTAMRAIQATEAPLFRRLADGLAAIPGVRLWGIADPARFGERTPTAAITIDGVTPRSAAEALGGAGIATWDGHFYALGLIERLGLEGSGGVLRIGLVHYNTAEEVDRLLDELARIAFAGAGTVAGSRA